MEHLSSGILLDIPKFTLYLSPQESDEKAHYEWRCILLSRSQDELTHTVIKDNNIQDYIFPIFDQIKSISNAKISSVLRTAINWHAQANVFYSGLNRFLNYWESIELLSHFFYDELPKGDTKRLSKSGRKNEIFRLMSQNIDKNNCIDVAKECAEILEPTVKTKMKIFLNIIDEKRLYGILFDKDTASNKSLYDIRGDIAHGNFSEHDREFVELVNVKLYLMRKLSAEVILKTVAYETAR